MNTDGNVGHGLGVVCSAFFFFFFFLMFFLNDFGKDEKEGIKGSPNFRRYGGLRQGLGGGICKTTTTTTTKTNIYQRSVKGRLSVRSEES